MSKIEVAVIGYRNHSRRIISILEKDNNISKILCFCYKKKICSELNRNKSSYKTTYSSDFSEVKKMKNIFISTPSKTHVYYIKKTVKNSKLIYCEKPSCTSKKDLKFLKKLPNRYKRKIFFGYNLLHSEPFKLYQKFFKNKENGKPIYANAILSNGIAFLKKFKNNWRFNSKADRFEKISGNNGSHMINMFLHLFGKIKKIKILEKGISNKKIVDISNINIIFNNGACVDIFLSYASPYSEKISFYFSNSILCTENKFTYFFHPRNYFNKLGMFTESKKKILLSHKNGWDSTSLKRSINFFIKIIKKRKSFNIYDFKKALITSEIIINNMKK